MPGGRIPADNRPAQAAGVGKNSKRHDLERREVPPLHGSDLQQGDVQALEQGQRVAPKQTQQPATGQPQATSSPQARTTGSAMQAPDAIQFAQSRSSGPAAIPTHGPGPSGSKLALWSPFLKGLVTGPGSSGGLAGAYITQMRLLKTEQTRRPSTVIDMRAIDAGFEAMLDESN